MDKHVKRAQAKVAEAVAPSSDAATTTNLDALLAEQERLTERIAAAKASRSTPRTSPPLRARR